jgi:hypothetical protein
MRPSWAALAIAALVLVGFVEAMESARQLDLLPGRGRPALTPAGTALSLVGLALSCGVYLLLGAAIARTSSVERDSVATGVLTGVGAGLLGGTVRAIAVSGYVGVVVVEGFGFPLAFLIAALAAFVLLSTVASAIGGGVLSWLGFRLGRWRSPRPQP